MAAAVDDASSVTLLRGLRSGGAADFTFVHRVDVCSAAPADLVANLAPVPGTDVAEGGYKSVWYFYCPKRYKNVHGKASGHRQRAIVGGDTCWHSETRPKPVKGIDGGATTCNLSFGRKEGLSRSFNRMGWCMTEYDDNHGGGGDHVLCKVYRSSSSLARSKLKPSSSSSMTASSEHASGCSKRKATDDGHPQAPPAKISHVTPAHQEHHQEKFMDLLQEPFPIGEDQCTFTMAELLACMEDSEDSGGVSTVDRPPEADSFAVDDRMPGGQEHHASGCSKRKATDDYFQAPPAKISHAQDFSYVDHQAQQEQFCSADHQVQQEQFAFDPMLFLSEDDQKTMPVDHQEQNDFDPMLLLKVDDGSKSANTGPLTPRTQAILNDLIRTCCTPPAAAAPPDAASFEFEALAFRYLAHALTS